MHVLLVKTSSLGDLIHTFPALTDARRALPDVRFDWLVEEAFREVPAWHPAVDRVLTYALRRWRRDWRRSWRRGEFAAFDAELRRDRYDQVLDAQGLLKSALPAWRARGPVAGLDRRSAREPLASRLYRQRIGVPRDLHAIERNRRLFAAALGYGVPTGSADYGLHFPVVREPEHPRLVLLHGTTWPSKHWPEPYWAELADLAGRAGFAVELPWGGPEDRLRAERIIGAAGHGQLLPQLGLTRLAERLACATGVVGVDSGLAHLAAALGTPAVTLYGPTRTGLTGALGPHQCNLQADFACAPCMQRDCTFAADAAGIPRPLRPPCFGRLPPARVWEALRAQMRQAGAL